MLFGQRRQKASHEGISRTVGVHDPGPGGHGLFAPTRGVQAEGLLVGYNYGILTYFNLHKLGDNPYNHDYIYIYIIHLLVELHPHGWMPVALYKNARYTNNVQSFRNTLTGQIT